jgi:uncharacterized protein YcfJ
MKHFANFSLLNKYTVTGGVLGTIAGYNLANRKVPANHYDEADALDAEYDKYYNSEPEEIVNKRWLTDPRVLSDQKKHKDWNDETDKRLVIGSLAGGLVGGLLGGKLGNYKPKANFGIGSTIGLGLAGGLAGNYIGNKIGRKPEIDNQFNELNTDFWNRHDKAQENPQELDNLYKEYTEKNNSLNDKYKDYKQGVDNRSNLGLAVGTGLGLLAANRKTLGNPVKAYKNWEWQQNRKNSMSIR